MVVYVCEFDLKILKYTFINVIFSYVQYTQYPWKRCEQKSTKSFFGSWVKRDDVFFRIFTVALHIF